MPAIIDNTLGVMFVGLLFATALWGVSCAQLTTYFNNSRGDPLLQRMLIAFVWLVDTVSLVLFSASVYFYAISNFADIFVLLQIPITLPISVPFLQGTGTLVQGFYAYRIWRLSQRNAVVTALAVLLITVETVLGIVFTIRTLPLHSLVAVNAVMGPLTTAYSTASVVTDWYIAGAMCFLFIRNRSRSRADSVLHRLILFTVTTGLLPSVCALAIFFAHLFDETGVIYLAPFFCIGKLYTISLLAALNMRTSIRAALVARASGSPAAVVAPAGSPTSSEAAMDGKHGLALGRRILSRRPSTKGIGSGQDLELSVKIDTVCESVVDPCETFADGAPRKWARRWSVRGQQPPVPVHTPTQDALSPTPLLPAGLDTAGSHRLDTHSIGGNKYDTNASRYSTPLSPVRLSESSMDV